MKTPIDIVKGKITDIDEHGIVTIKCRYDDWRTLLRRQYSECLVQMIDSRPLSDKQRRTRYKLLREISNYTGMGLDPTKEYMKLKFLVEDLEQTADQMFSLSNAPMSLVCAFQRFLVHFILDWDMPCSFPLLNFVDDVQDYIYACLSSKKCCICGKPCDLHNVDPVGAGCGRDEIIHEGMEVIPLCREHRAEVHAIGWLTFQEKHHLNGGVTLDKFLCKIYKLKRKEDNEYAEQNCTDGAPDPRP